MQSRIFYLVFLGLISLLVLTASPVAAQRCGNLELSLVVGQAGRVTPGPPNNIRSDSSANSSRIGTIPGGETFDVLEGPRCTNGFAWWRVNFDGTVGWTAEFDANGSDYWLEPILDGVLIQHPHLVDSNNQLRDLSIAGVGGGGCVISGISSDYISFRNSTLYYASIMRDGLGADADSYIVAFVRDRVTRVVARGPNGVEVEAAREDMVWYPAEACAVYPNSELLQDGVHYDPVTVVRLSPRAYFYPGNWNIQVTTPRSTSSATVRVDDGDNPIVGGEAGISYIYNIQPNEQLRLLMFDWANDFDYISTYAVQADRNGRVAYFSSIGDARVGIIVGEASAYMQFIPLFDWEPDDLEPFLRRIYWP